MAKDPLYQRRRPGLESREDVRYSVIRYVSTDIQNAMGPHVHDPRTGRNSGIRHHLVSQCNEFTVQLVFHSNRSHQVLKQDSLNLKMKSWAD